MRKKWLPLPWFIFLKKQERELAAGGSTARDSDRIALAICLECGGLHNRVGECPKRRKAGTKLPSEPECSLCGFHHSWDSDCPKPHAESMGKRTTPEEDQEIAGILDHNERRFIRRWVTNR